jgi:N-acyl-D-amino-acid deacylase
MMLAGGASMVYHFMSDDDVERIMRHPHVGFASDAGVLTFGSGAPHPRGYGNAARVLGMYVGKEGPPLEEAVRRMTSLPAAAFPLRRPGADQRRVCRRPRHLRPGSRRRHSDLREAPRYAAGIPHVIVNGVLVVKDGEHTNARPGAVLTLAR